MTKKKENKKKTLAKPAMIDGEMWWPTKNFKGTYYYEDGPIYFLPAPKFENLSDEILEQLKENF